MLQTEILISRTEYWTLMIWTTESNCTLESAHHQCPPRMSTRYYPRFFQLRTHLYSPTNATCTRQSSTAAPHTPPRIHTLELTYTKEPALKLGKYAPRLLVMLTDSISTSFPRVALAGSPRQDLGSWSRVAVNCHLISVLCRLCQSSKSLQT